MDDADATTPRSTADPPLLKAPKDKNCPFCGQAFTSSSLGRHLDLYIRPKNPKAPDGIHLVDEIRKLRGSITRRQAKGSSSTPTAKREESGNSTPTTKKKHVTVDDSSMLVQSPEDNDGEVDMSKGRASARLGVKTPDMRRDVSRQLQKADLEQRHRTNEEAEIASATEMALKELLKSVRDANAKASGSGLFDFDPYSLNFPSLCLHILPAPSTLFSSTPFATAESWSITPPGQKQLEALNRHVRERLLAHQRQKQINQVYPAGTQSNASSAANSPLPTPPLFDPDPQKLFGHIADAFNHWTHQTDKARQEYWQIAVLRCYARADDRRREAEVQLENARREIEYLKANRWTSGAPEVCPITIRLGSDTTKELGKLGMDYRNWDYDRLINKWRTAIRDSKLHTSGMAAQKPLPDGPPSTRSGSLASIAPLPLAPINRTRPSSPVKTEGPMPYSAPPTVIDDPGSDQIDAEGEDDDDDVDVDLTPHTASEDDPMNQIQHQVQAPPNHQPQHQHHGMQLQPAPMHSQQQLQSHMHNPIHVSQAQVHNAQVQAQAQAWAAARNQEFRQQHQHQQMSPHVQHIASANNSRRQSLAMMDPHSMNPNQVNNMAGSMGMQTGMEGIENHQDQFLRMDMGLSAGFVGSNDGSVSMGA